MQTQNPVEEEPITAINITPLVDVALVLVIIFMMTMPFLVERALKVKTSEQKVVPVSSANQPILIEILNEGVQLEGKTVAITDLESDLSQLFRERGIKAVVVSAKKEVIHEKVVHILDLANRSGAENLDLLEPEELKVGEGTKWYPPTGMSVGRGARPTSISEEVDHAFDGYSGR